MREIQDLWFRSGLHLIENSVHHWTYVTGAISVAASAVVSAHAILYKRDLRAAAGWVGVIWLAPFIGSILYVLFGINRIQRRAARLRGSLMESGPDPSATFPDIPLPESARHFKHLIRLVGTIVRKPAMPGNRVTPLYNGEEAYPAMLDAIKSAQSSILLSTYIFDTDSVGKKFVAALKEAVSRGVSVHALIDDVGARSSWPSVFGELEEAGVRAAEFMPTRVPVRAPFMNLRSHKKILIADGKIGFTGGMNISEDHCPSLNPLEAFQDVHFQVEGPVLSQMESDFIEDWTFCTDETLQPVVEPRALESKGPVIARGIPDGPDEDFENLRWVIHAAIQNARKRIRIVTPYFLPDQSMILALNIAALSGIRVDIVLPQDGNLLVQWAAQAQHWQLLERGCRIYLSPPPFDHSKIIVIDGEWSLIGSANLDPRSLRLNFEFNLECYDAGLARALEHKIEEKLTRAHPLTLEEADRRTLIIKLRDGAARLFSPYL